MKTNLEPMPLYKRPRLQHMKRLALTALTAVMLSGMVAGCDAVIVEPPEEEEDVQQRPDTPEQPPERNLYPW